METPAPLWAEALARKERQIVRKENGDAHIVERLMPAMWALAAGAGTRREIPPGIVQSRRRRLRRQNNRSRIQRQSSRSRIRRQNNRSRIRKQSSRSSRQCCTVHPVADRWRRIPDTADTVGQSSNDGEMIDVRNQNQGYGKKAERPHRKPKGGSHGIRQMYMQACPLDLLYSQRSCSLAYTRK